MLLLKTYLRILSYAAAIWRLALCYFFTTVLAIFFGLINLSMFIPLLEVLFSQCSLGNTMASLSKPSLSFGFAYLKDLFNYYLVNVIATHGHVRALYFVCIAMVVAVLFANFFRYVAELLAVKMRIHVVYNLRKTLCIKTLHLHRGYFTQPHQGDIMARLMTDVQEVEHALIHIFRVFFKEPATILGFFTVLFYMSSHLTWMALLFLPVIIGVVRIIIKRLLKRAIQSQLSLSKLTNIVGEILQGIHVIQSFAAFPYVLNKFKQENKNYAKINLSMSLKHSLVPLLSEFLGVLVLALLLVYGGKLVLLHQSTFSASTFITYLLIFSQALVPVKSITRSLSSIQRGLAAGERIFSLIDTMPAIVNSPNAQAIKSLQCAITFKEVSFTYHFKPVLQQLNLTIAPGKKTALLGPSGSGKSTIINLLTRYYEVTQGAIQMNGNAIQNYDIQSLRNSISVVTQAPRLFHDTVLNNIALSRPAISERAVIAAARIAHAHDFICALPQGYQTVIGGQGTKLSTGQAQRLNLARAVLDKPLMLILDEATSALDSDLEERIHKELDQLMQDKTLLVITHRLRTIQDADHIFVIDAGKVVAQGTHEVLMQQQGLYKRWMMDQK